jgi:sialate O-acetylesterase
VADSNGAWRVRFAALSATTGDAAIEMVASDGSTTHRIADVLVGEVWVCSGQSNMEWPLRAAQNAEKEIADANFPRIRAFSISHAQSVVPATDCVGSWVVCAPATAGFISAVAYHFGRHLHQELDGVPIGLIVNAWSGMIAEPYTPLPALKAEPLFEAMVTNAEQKATTYLARKSELDREYATAQVAYESKRAAWERQIVASDPGVSNGWNGLEADTNGWRVLRVPGVLEETDPSLKNASFTAWLRREVVLPPDCAGRDLALHMGPIDEVDITSFNGREIGRTWFDVPRHWTASRRYAVPGALVRPGTNVVAVWMMNLYGESGPLGVADMYRLEPADGGAGAVGLGGDWVFRRGQAIDRRTMPKPPPAPREIGAGGAASVYNGMVAPLVPYAIRGAIWYQGESNAGRAWQYRSLLPALIGGWRSEWGQGDFPFLIVQLANFMGQKPQPSESQWAELREAQALTAQTVPNCALAVAIDVGDAADIHPRNKKDVGIRLGRAAESVAYGRKLVSSGPVYESVRAEAGAMRVAFRSVGGALRTRGASVEGFAVAGEDRKFFWADARIEGATVLVSCTNVPNPVAVRYAWADNPKCDLYNTENLPAVPFRTDDWPGLTWPKAQESATGTNRAAPAPPPAP